MTPEAIWPFGAIWEYWDFCSCDSFGTWVPRTGISWYVIPRFASKNAENMIFTSSAHMGAETRALGGFVLLQPPEIQEGKVSGPLKGAAFVAHTRPCSHVISEYIANRTLVWPKGRSAEIVT